MLEKEPKIKDTILEITALRGKNRFTSEEDSLHQKSDHNVYKDFIKLFKLIIHLLKKKGSFTNDPNSDYVVNFIQGFFINL